MCGIVGYVGHKGAQEVVVEGLRRLEYRGYDSAGIALVVDGALATEKRAGKHKVPGRRYRNKFRQSLDNAEQNDGQQIIHATAPNRPCLRYCTSQPCATTSSGVAAMPSAARPLAFAPTTLSCWSMSH